MGMEVEAESERGEGRGSESDKVSLEVEDLKMKIAELETRIGEAVSDEVEDYELAGWSFHLHNIMYCMMMTTFSHAAELDKELHVLKEKLTSIIAN